MRLALAQINPTVGDIDGNVALIERWIGLARKERADLVVLPELCVTGYPPRDLLLAEGFIDDVVRASKRLGETATDGITAIFGAPLPVERSGGGRGVANALLAYRDGELIAYYDKRLLPTYDVFDEDRYFVPGERAVAIDVAGWKVGLSVCEDMWSGEDVGFGYRYTDRPDPIDELAASMASHTGPKLIVNPSASPFVLGKLSRHHAIIHDHATRHGVHVASVNQVGANDELIFSGHSGVFDPAGRLISAAPGFKEHLLVTDLEGATETPDPVRAAPDDEQLYRALVLGVRDYLGKTGFTSAVIGLSGGIDSAVTAVIAVAALGAGNVSGVSMPSRYSSEGSKTDAQALADHLGIAMETVPIEGPFQAVEHVLPLERETDVTHQNIQSRLRGLIMMAFSNKTGALLLTTGNKSEMAVGYCTLYGDMNGGLAVLCDVSKQNVYRLARWMNENRERLGIDPTPGDGPIPTETITKPPSAELAPDQLDADSLPPYDVLDEILERYIENRQHPRRIIEETGIDGATVARVVRMVDVNEYKRKQVAIGLKVTGVAFGSGRRMPIAQRWRPDRQV